MSELVEIVGSLEDKIGKLLHKLEVLQQSNSALKGELRVAQNQLDHKGQSVSEWEEKYKSLKLANSVLGSNTDKTEAKLKINTLIRELDHCIAQLAE